MTAREPLARRQLRVALVAMAGSAVAAYGWVTPGGWLLVAGYVAAAGASWASIRRMPQPPALVEGLVGIWLALGLAAGLWVTGSLVLAAGGLLAIVQGLLAPRAAGRLQRWAVAGGIVGHLFAAQLWTMSAAAASGYLTALALLGMGGAFTLALAHRVAVAEAWADALAPGAAARLQDTGAGRGSVAGAAWISLAALGFAAVTFAMIPRPSRGGGGSGPSSLAGLLEAASRPLPPGRPPAGDRSRPGSTGFRDRVQFDDLGPIKQDVRVAMRVRCKDRDNQAVTPAGDLLLRGVAFDRYEQHRWSTSADIVTRAYADADDGLADRRTTVARPPTAAPFWVQTVEPVTVDAPYAFHTGQLLAASFDQLVYDGNGTAALDAPPPVDPPYRVWTLATLPSARSLEAAGATADAAWCHMPWRGERSLASLVALRERLAGGETNPYRLARTLERAMRRHFRYTLSVPKPPAGTEPLAPFIRGEQPGHCEYFASTMVLLLRTANLPCRLVAGFRTGEIDRRYGEPAYIVRHRDAHAWVEVRFDGVGWVPFDPSPSDDAASGPVQVAPVAPPDLPPPSMAEDEAAGPGLAERVLAFDAEERASLLDRAGGLWGLTLLVGLAGIVGLVGLRGWQRLAAREPGADGRGDLAAARWRAAAPGFYATLVRVLRGAGFRRPPSGTPRELARAVRQGHGPAPAAVDQVTRIFESVRYGLHPLQPETESEMRALVDEVEASAAEERV